jgi:6-pyruvoyltetrahydropterin/6-carboxytetrahydropterin synthase
MQYITRKGSFDSMHRVMNEAMKCFNVHGHTYLYELTFQFQSTEEIGYAIDFKEIKRVACQWIDDNLDHGSILNPDDTDLIEAVQKLGSKCWVMGLNGEAYCNPTVENIAKEIFLAMLYLFEKRKGISIYQVRLWETPNCYTDCFRDSISDEERMNFSEVTGLQLKAYAKEKGIVEYDDRKTKRK